MPSEDTKPVKMKSEVKDEEGDEEKSLFSIMENGKKKLANGNANLTAKSAKVNKEEPLDYDSDKPIRARSRESKVKKEENADDDDEDEKPLAAKRSSTAKPHKDLKKKKKKKKKEEEKKKNTAAEQKKREKKVYDLPGQKRDTPEERDPLRIFYETLYKQIPHSEMAQFWMMECGLLPELEAKKVFEKKQKRSQHQKFSSPTKAVKNTASATVKKTPSSQLSSSKKNSTESKDPPKLSKKRKIGDANSDNDSDDDFLISKAMKKKQVT